MTDPARPQEGWIDWHGGECPVPGGTLVDVKHAEGDASCGQPAGFWREGSDWWKHEGEDSCNIIAYRLHTPEPTQPDLLAEALEALRPFALADKAIGDEPGAFRFETGTGYRLVEREDFRRAASVLKRAEAQS